MTTTETTEVRVELLDPHDLAPHPRNVRADLGDLAGLTASIAEQGVIEPLTVVPTPDGYQLVAGHRRAAAAIAAGLDRVPCVVRADLIVDTDDSPGVAEHIGTMLAENLQRSGLTAAEEARGVKQMLDLGMPISKVAKRTGLGQKRVKLAIGVTRLDDESLRLVDDSQLTMEQAAAVALFPDDGDAIARLASAAKDSPGRFAHVLEQEKQKRKRQAAFEARVAELRVAGRVVVDVSTHGGPTNRRLTTLYAADGSWLGDQAEPHRSCPGSAAHLEQSWDGSIHETEVCVDFAANGHIDRNTSSGSAKPETEEEKKAAAAERRQVIENNRAMAAANAVRRAWVKDFLSRRSAPKEVLRFAIEEIAVNPGALRGWLGSESAIEKDVDEALGVQKPVRPWSMSASSREARETLTTGEKVTDARLPLQLLAHVAGGIESDIPKDAWRSGHRQTAMARWFTFLAGLGYTLSDIEQQIFAEADGPRP